MKALRLFRPRMAFTRPTKSPFPRRTITEDVSLQGGGGASTLDGGGGSTLGGEIDSTIGDQGNPAPTWNGQPTWEVCTHTISLF